MTPDEVRASILDLVQLYHDKSFVSKPFVPGVTPCPVNGRVFDADEIQTLVSASLDFWLTSGPYAARFERDFAAFMGVEQAVLCNSGSSANLLAMASMLSPKSRFEPGDEVITVAAAFPTTVNPIVQLGGVPVFVDVTLPSYNVDVDKIERALSNRTKGVILAHAMGNPFDLPDVMDLCVRRDLWLVSDCCDAVGARYDGIPVANWGNAATTSHYPAHHITAGEGGCVLVHNCRQRKAVESFRDWGRSCFCEPGHDGTCRKRFGWKLGTLPKGYDHKYSYSHIGYNLKATDLQAAILCAQLKKLPRFILERNANYGVLRNALADLSDVLMFTDPAPNAEPSWFGFPIAVREGARFTRDDLTQHLESKKIGTRLLFAGNITRQPAYQGVPYRQIGDLPNSDFVVNNVCWIGVYPGLTQEMLDYMATTIREFIRGR